MHNEIMAAIKHLEFDTFENYVCARATWTLVRMADELHVKAQRFIAYHKRWVDANYKGEKDGRCAERVSRAECN